MIAPTKTKAPTKKLSDFELTIPSSLREIIVDEVVSNNQRRIANGKDPIPLEDDRIEATLEKWYENIEKGAMETYQSNQGWALKKWVYDNMLIVRQEIPMKDKNGSILRDDNGEPITKWADAPLVANQENDFQVSELIKPILKWQDKTSDPLKDFRNLLESSYSPDTAKNYMRIATDFVNRYGKKKSYNQSEILEYIADLRKRYKDKDSSYATNVFRLKSFLDSIPNDQPFPVKPKQMPKYPEKIRGSNVLTE